MARCRYAALLGLCLALAGPGAAGEAAPSAGIPAVLREVRSALAAGRVDHALGRVEAALALPDAGRPGHRIPLLIAASDAHLLVRRMEAAGRHAAEAVAAARAAEVPAPLLAAALNAQGNMRLAQGASAEALSAYEEAIGLADPALRRRLRVNAAHAALAAGGTQEARSHLLAAMEAGPDLRHPAQGITTRIAAGALATQVAAGLTDGGPRLLRAAFQVLGEARRLAAARGDARARSSAAGHLGELYAQTGQAAEAQRMYREALAEAGRVPAPELLGRWHWRLGELHRAGGRPAQARAAYRAAVERLEQVRSALALGTRGDPVAYRDQPRSVYMGLAELLIEQAEAAADPDEGGRALREVLDVLEGFKAAELQEYYQDECVAELRARTAAQRLDALVEPGTAVLYPVLLEERTVLLASFAGGEIRRFEGPAGIAELREAAGAFRRQLLRKGNPRRIRRRGERLYRWLIAPVEEALEARRVHTLVVVPDDALRTIPFAALFDGRDFLVRRYALVVTPGLTLTDPGRPIEGGEHRVLLNGLSTGVEGFADLPFVEAEIERIAEGYRAATLVNDAFLRRVVRRELRRTDYTAVTFATHAQFLGDADRSFLLAHDGRIGLDELERLVGVGRLGDRSVELLVLSACETAVGDQRAALGLAGVAVKAGARTVVASLWAVNDFSTAELVPAFFQHMKDPALSKAQALQRAQLRLLDHPRYNDPWQWAPFVLIGNWL